MQTDEEKFLELDNVVQCLFNKGLLSDIECRKIISRASNALKIVCDKAPNTVVKIHAAIYETIFTKDTKTIIKILDVFRERVHPLQNPRILLRIFSYLGYADVAKCKFVFQEWKELLDLLVASKYGQVDQDEFLLMNLLLKNEQIQNAKSRVRKNALKASVFQLMLAANADMEETMLERLQIGNGISPDFNTSSIQVLCATENMTGNLMSKALSNNTILSNVFKFLSLSDIKNCRRVCRTWCSVSEPYLRRISTIKFDSKFGPSDFLNVSKYLPLSDLHFEAFKFRKTFPSEEVSQIFTNISNLTELHYVGTLKHRGIVNAADEFRIPWKKLPSIKILCLTATVIEIDGDNEWKRITPLKVHLNQVKFFVGGSFPKEIILNDYIDFTKATDIYVHGCSQYQQFDWAKDTFTAKKATFSNIDFINAGNSKSAVEFLKLYCKNPFPEKNCMSIKQMMVDQFSTELSTLPPSMEKLALTCSRISSREPILYFPNLTYLSYRKNASDALDVLSHFENCPNLTDMEILKMANIERLPRNLKRLKVELPSHTNFFGRLAEDYLDLNLLILNNVAVHHLHRLKFDKIRPKVLVLDMVYPYDEDDDVLSFMRRYNYIHKLYIQYPPLVYEFSRSKLSNVVDKQSNTYEFCNERGKAITSQEFCTIQKSLDVMTVMKEFFLDKKNQRKISPLRFPGCESDNEFEYKVDDNDNEEDCDDE